MSDHVLTMTGIEKEYSGNTVLQGVNLNVKKGKIHALLGENGAGKSTLMNILFGMPVIHSTGGFKGEITLNGESVSIKSPNDAMHLGIGMVHQEFMLIPNFTITENIKLNRENFKDPKWSKRWNKFIKKEYKFLDFDSMDQDARVALSKIGLDIDADRKVSGLPVGYMQFIEIAREIDKKNMQVLVFDEPTAVLTESEATRLMDVMEAIAATGVAIIFITHRLDEVMKIADEVIILRDGKQVATRKKEDTNVVELAQLMVGRTVERVVSAYDVHDESEKEVALQIKNLRVNMPGERVEGVDLDIYQGEILGIGGLAGQGKIGIANGLMGIYPATGEVMYNGETLELNNTYATLSKDIAFVSEDRKGFGLLLEESIELNIVITAMQIQDQFLKDYILFKMKASKEIREYAERMIEDLDIRCTGPQQLSGRLSGGNQQKVCLARALTLNPKVLFVSEPTRGIDIGAKKLVLELLVKLSREKGIAVIITSSELSELRSISDRIAIVSKGEIAGILKPDDSDADFGLLMSGLTRQEGESNEG